MHSTYLVECLLPLSKYGKPVSTGFIEVIAPCPAVSVVMDKCPLSSTKVGELKYGNGIRGIYQASKYGLPKNEQYSGQMSVVYDKSGEPNKLDISHTMHLEQKCYVLWTNVHDIMTVHLNRGITMKSSELYKEFCIKTPLHKWWKREIKSLGLVEGEDYTIEVCKGGKGNITECIFGDEAVAKIRAKYGTPDEIIFRAKKEGAISGIEYVTDMPLERDVRVCGILLHGYNAQEGAGYIVVPKGTKVTKEEQMKYHFILGFHIGIVEV